MQQSTHGFNAWADVEASSEMIFYAWASWGAACCAPTWERRVTPRYAAGRSSTLVQPGSRRAKSLYALMAGGSGSRVVNAEVGVRQAARIIRTSFGIDFW